MGAIEHIDGLATLENLRNALTTGLRFVVDIPPHELAYFVNRELIIATSCEERRIGQWEKQFWLQFVKAEGKSPAYRRYLAAALTRALVAAKSETASARTIGQIGLALATSATGLIPQYAPDLISGGTATVDWYVSAMPIDRLRNLLTPELLAADASLTGIRHLQEDWMVGIQYFLSRRADVPPAHIAALGTPWALTALFQARPWGVDFAASYGDGSVHDCLSVDISDWDTPGILFGKIAKRCTADEIAKEVWAQLSRAMNAGGSKLLKEEIVAWSLDPGISWSGGMAQNATPLMVNTADTYRHRPNAYTGLSSFFIGGDHVKSNIDLATMEGANESGRRVTNAIIDAADSPASKAPVYPLWELPALDPLKQQDLDRYRAGQPHILDF